MKTTLFLSLSAALNLAFAVLFFAGRSSAPSEPVAPSARAPKAAAAQPKIDATIWPALDSSELPTLIERLKASGFPPSLIRAIIAAQIGETFAARRKALRGDLANRPYWKDSNSIDPKIFAAEREIDRQQRKLMRDLFGDEADADDTMRNLYQNRTFSFLPAEKADEIRRILRDYDERRTDLYAANPVFDREKTAALDKEQRAAIAAALTPAELFEYDLRNSNTAQRLRDELSAFNPTEEEYRTIFRMRQPFDEKYDYNVMGMMSSEESRQRFEAEKVLKDQIKAALGPRGAEYDRSIDYNYRRSTQLLARLELPRQNADQLYAVQQEIYQRRGEAYKPGMTPDQRNAQLVALQKDAVTKVAPLIGGEKNLDVYKQYGGSWIDSLIPRPRPGTPTTAPATPATAVPKS